MIESDLTVLTFNIDTNIVRMEEGLARPCFSNFRANERTPYVINTLSKIIKSDHPDIINVQEGRKFKTKFGDEVDSVSTLVESLENQGYKVLVDPYNDTGDKAFKYITAYNPETLSLTMHYVKYFSKTPDEPTKRPSTENRTEEEVKQIVKEIKENNFGQEWEWGTFVYRLEHIESKEIIYSFNVHIHNMLGSRMPSSNLMVEFAKEILNKEPNAKIVMAGDFNTIPQRSGPEQMEIFNKATYQDKLLLNEATSDLKLPNGYKVDFTFIPQVYDFSSNDQRLNSEQNMTQVLLKLEPEERKEKIIDVYEKECQALDGILDHVFTHGFTDPQATLIPALTSDESPESYQEEVVRKFIVNFTRKYDKPAFSSDHQPILTKMKFSK